MGVHPFGDPSISDDFERVALNLDAQRVPRLRSGLDTGQIRFFVDDELVREVAQSPAYPMQLILSLYEFADGPALASAADSYPKEFMVDWVRGWRAG